MPIARGDFLGGFFFRRLSAGYGDHVDEQTNETDRRLYRLYVYMSIKKISVDFLKLAEIFPGQKSWENFLKNFI